MNHFRRRCRLAGAQPYRWIMLAIDVTGCPRERGAMPRANASGTAVAMISGGIAEGRAELIGQGDAIPLAPHQDDCARILAVDRPEQVTRAHMPGAVQGARVAAEARARVQMFQHGGGIGHCYAHGEHPPLLWCNGFRRRAGHGGMDGGQPWPSVGLRKRNGPDTVDIPDRRNLGRVWAWRGIPGGVAALGRQHRSHTTVVSVASRELSRGGSVNEGGQGSKAPNGPGGNRPAHGRGASA